MTTQTTTWRDDGGRIAASLRAGGGKRGEEDRGGSDEGGSGEVGSSMGGVGEGGGRATGGDEEVVKATTTKVATF